MSEFDFEVSGLVSLALLLGDSGSDCGGGLASGPLGSLRLLFKNLTTQISFDPDLVIIATVP